MGGQGGRTPGGGGGTDSLSLGTNCETTAPPPFWPLTAPVLQPPKFWKILYISYVDIRSIRAILQNFTLKPPAQPDAS